MDGNYQPHYTQTASPLKTGINSLIARNNIKDLQKTVQVNPLDIPKRKLGKHRLGKQHKKLRAEKDLFMMNFRMNVPGFPVQAHGYGQNDSRGDLRPNY